MGWAQQLPSGRWRAMYRVGGKQLNATPGVTYTRRDEAVRKANAKEERARADPHDIDIREGRITWGTWVEHWWPLRGVEPGTADRDLDRRRKHLDPHWGHVPLNDIRRDDIQRWINWLGSDDGGRLGAQSVIHCAHLLSSSLADAVRDRRLARSPYTDLRLPTPPEGNERFLTHAEVDRIARVLPEPARTMVLLLVGSGLRWGEAAGLHWHHVDLDDGYIDVVDVHDDHQRQIKPYPKGRRRRRVWIPLWLADELDRHRYDHPPTHCAAEHRRDSRCRSSLVVPNTRGGALPYASFRQRHWGAAVGREVWRAVGDPEPDRVFLNPSEAARRVATRELPLRREWQDGLARIGPATIHDLRHTFASWALQAEPPMPIYDLAIAMGHTDTSITRRYGHLARSSRERFRRALAWPEDPPGAPPAAGLRVVEDG